ncbi:MAG: S9 family peptidase, partial [Alphaproteobacteria bacterium]
MMSLPALAADGVLTPETLIGLSRIAEFRLSPDTEQVAYVLREADLAANKDRSSLWLAPRDRRRGAPRALAPSDGDDSAPRWAADGKSVYFLS